MSPSENWIKEQLRIAGNEALSLPQWKRDAAREALRPIFHTENSSHLEHATPQSRNTVCEREADSRR